MRKQVYSLIVDNTPGVLSRIAGLFSRRGYSIDSITAGMTADPRFTRITVVSSGDELILSQIEKQLRKLEDVVDIKMLKENPGLFMYIHNSSPSRVITTLVEKDMEKKREAGKQEKV